MKYVTAFHIFRGAMILCCNVLYLIIVLKTKKKKQRNNLQKLYINNYLNIYLIFKHNCFLFLKCWNKPCDQIKKSLESKSNVSTIRKVVQCLNISTGRLSTLLMISLRWKFLPSLPATFCFIGFLHSMRFLLQVIHNALYATGCSSTTNENIKALKKIILDNRRITIR